MDEVVQVAADGARRNKLRADFEIRNLRLGMRQQPELQFARQRQIALQTLLLPGNLLVQPRVLDRNRNLRRQRGQRALVIFGEISAARMLQIEHADHFFLVDQRHRQFRARLRIQQDVARILAHIRNQHRFLALRGISHQSASKRDVVLQVQTLLEAQREAVLQFFAVSDPPAGR